MRPQIRTRAARTRGDVLFDTAPVGTVAIARDGTVVAANDALCRLLGMDAAELVGRPFVECVHPEDRALHRAQLRRASAERDRVDAEHRLIRGDGTTLWASIGTAGVIDEAGAVVEHLICIEDVSERREAAAVLAHTASHDPLTGLGNRVALVEHLHHAMQSAAETIAVLVVDLDRFRLVNDVHGHGTADVVLFTLAARLRGALRANDVLARAGGDEFAVVCTDLTPGAAIALGQRLIAAVARPIMLGSREIRVTASAGVAVAAKGDAGTVSGAAALERRRGKSTQHHSAERLLADADSAMTHAKHLGRARCELFDDVMRARSMTRARIEGALERAVRDHSLAVAYQPIVSLQDGVVVGAEALARWNHPDLGEVPPLMFLPVAEDSGHIVTVGHWVLSEACRAAVAWSAMRGESRYGPVHVTVNLSPRQLDRPGVASAVESVLAETGLPANGLWLEITESLLVEASTQTLKNLHDLDAMGIALGIDDFGTGYASLSYVKQLPVKFVKLDRSFVTGVGTNREDTAIVRAVLALAASLDLVTVAEGIETAEQAQMLAAMGCTRGQGFYFARPDSAHFVGQALISGLGPGAGARSNGEHQAQHQ